MKDELKNELLMALSQLDAPWVEKTGYSSEGTGLNWLTVAVLSDGRFRLGLTSHGLWARSTDAVVQTVDDKSACVFFLPVLENLPEVACGKIIDGLRHYGLSEEFINLFPFEQIVIVGLNSHSEYWCTLALRWVLFIPRSDDLKDALEFLSKAGETQKIRHTAKKLFRS